MACSVSSQSITEPHIDNDEKELPHTGGQYRFARLVAPYEARDCNVVERDLRPLSLQAMEQPLP